MNDSGSLIVTKIRRATLQDEQDIFDLYRSVAGIEGGLARKQNEITKEYIHYNLKASLVRGLSLVAVDPAEKIIGEIHAYKLEPTVFEHVLSELTIAVHHNYQGKGIGKKLFSEFLRIVDTDFSDIYRVELIARESNDKAISFYKNLGFAIEGRLRKRIANSDGTFEDDIIMARVKH